MGEPNAIDAWRQLLGDAQVSTDADALGAASTATWATKQRVSCVLRPSSLEEVKGILHVAATFKAPVYVVSRGRNYGYGSKVPPRDGCALVELSRMNRIVAFDDTLGTLTVEPGVTFEQAANAVAGSRFQVTTIGGPPDASLIGNVLERGDGRGPHPDVFANVCALQAMLPDGRVIETGLGRFTNARAQHHLRWGLGPMLDGLFSQSNLGVVTRMTFFLARRPGFYRDVFGTLATADALPALIDGLRDLALEGTLRAGVFVWNDLKALSVQRQYPYEKTQGRTPLPPPFVDAWREHFGAWAVSSGVYAPNEAIGEAEAERVREVLGPLLSKLEVSAPESDDTPMLGTPSARNLAMVYWRKRTPMPAEPDPDRDRCGFLWSSAAVPFRGDEAVRALEIAEPVSRLFGFEPNLAFLGPTPRCLYLVSSIVWDRDAKGEDERAQACFAALERELNAAGYLPTRLGIASFPWSLKETDDSDSLLRQLKALVDPQGILSPGRYGL